METIEVTICKTNTGFSAHMEEIPGIATTGKTIKEIKENMWKAVKFHLQILKKDNEPVPKCLQGIYDLVFNIDIESLLSYYKYIITQTSLSRITGINPKLLSHYAKGLKVPRPKQTEKIIDGLYGLGIELLSLKP